MEPDPAMLDDLIALMEIPSVTGSEDRIAAYLLDRLATTHRHVILDGKSVLAPPPLDPRPLVVLAGHIDTVPPSGNESPRRDGEWIWGRGAVDMKAGLAVIASLLGDPAIGAGWARVGTLLYAGEEGPHDENDLGRLLSGPARWALEAGLALLLEPTDEQIEVGCVGAVNVEAIFRGAACHSARPWLGTNAVGVALPWLERITSYEPRDHIVHGFLFRETASITMLRAGTARNVVPGELVANVNYRFPPGRTLEEACAAARALVREAEEIRLVDAAPSGSIPIDRPCFAAFLERSGLPARGKQGWTDVARFTELGVPALNFGPGDPQFSHRDDERVKIGAMGACFATLRSFLIGAGPFGSRLVETERR